MTTRFEALLFLNLFITFAYFYQGGFANQNDRFNLSMSIAFDHSVAYDKLHENTIDKINYKGHYYTTKAPLGAILALPVPVLASFFIDFDSLIESPELGDLLLYLGTIFSVSLLSAWSSIFFFRTLALINPHISNLRKYFLTNLVFLGTLMLPYSTMLFGHQITASLFIILIYYAIKNELSKSPQYFVTLGFLFGLMFANEYTSAIFAIPLLYYFWPHITVRRLLLVLSGLVAPLSLVGIINYLSYGNPFSLSYGKLQGTQFASQMSKGIFGVSLPNISNIIELLFGLYRGLFVYCPILVIAILCYFYWPRHLNRLKFSIVIAFILSLLVNSGYSYWQGGSCFGPRHLIMAIPSLAFGFAFFPDSWCKNIFFWLTSMTSVLFCLTGTAITPFLSEEVLRPFEVYYDLASYNLVSINPSTYLAPTDDLFFRWDNLDLFQNASLNLGELLGFEGLISLVPLLVLWIVTTCFALKLNSFFEQSAILTSSSHPKF